MGEDYRSYGNLAWTDPEHTCPSPEHLRIKVSLALSPYDLSKGRITFRHIDSRGSIVRPRPRY